MSRNLEIIWKMYWHCSRKYSPLSMPCTSSFPYRFGNRCVKRIGLVRDFPGPRSWFQKHISPPTTSSASLCPHRGSLHRKQPSLPQCLCSYNYWRNWTVTTTEGDLCLWQGGFNEMFLEINKGNLSIKWEQ